MYARLDFIWFYFFGVMGLCFITHTTHNQYRATLHGGKAITQC